MKKILKITTVAMMLLTLCPLMPTKAADNPCKFSVGTFTSSPSPINGGSFTATATLTFDGTTCSASNDGDIIFSANNISSLTIGTATVSDYTNGTEAGATATLTVTGTHQQTESRGAFSYTLKHKTVSDTDVTGSVTLNTSTTTVTPPYEPDEPSVPDTPTGYVFRITEDSKVPSIDAGKQATLNIPITRLQYITGGKAQVEVTLPEGLNFAVINNIQHVEFKRSKDYNVEIPIEIEANSKMETGTYPITLKIKYKYDGGDQEDTLTYYVKVIGKGEVSDPDVVQGTPRIIIESYYFGGAEVKGGVPFTLSMSFRNTNSDVDIKNLKITVSSSADEETGGVFTPTASSNSFFVANLAHNTSVGKAIVLMPRNDAKPKSYGIDITFDYEAMVNKELKSFSTTEKVSIPVVQSDRFEIGEVTTWGMFYVGQPSDVNVMYTNKGKTTINNLEVKVEGENFTTETPTSYIGNVESGSSDMFYASILPNEAGAISGTITFTYEDANGDSVKVVKEFTGEAQSMNIGPDMPIDPVEPMPEEPAGLPTWSYIAMGLGAVGAVGGGVYFVKKKKAKKDEAEEDDFDEE